jgi:hypothetical protein
LPAALDVVLVSSAMAAFLVEEVRAAEARVVEDLAAEARGVEDLAAEVRVEVLRAPLGLAAAAAPPALAPEPLFLVSVMRAS